MKLSSPETAFPKIVVIISFLISINFIYELPHLDAYSFWFKYHFFKNGIFSIWIFLHLISFLQVFALPSLLLYLFAASPKPKLPVLVAKVFIVMFFLGAFLSQVPYQMVKRIKLPKEVIEKFNFMIFDEFKKSENLIRATKNTDINNIQSFYTASGQVSSKAEILTAEFSHFIIKSFQNHCYGSILFFFQWYLLMKLFKRNLKNESL